MSSLSKKSQDPAHSSDNMQPSTALTSASSSTTGATPASATTAVTSTTSTAVATTITAATVSANNALPMSKKDKRRQQIQTKLNKIEDQFHNDKDYYYRDSLIQLQYKLSSLHSGDNPQFLQKIKDFEERRDYELVRLKLSEEYQVQFVNKEFKEDYDRAVSEREQVIQLVKNKLQERIGRKIKQLKEDKALIDIATSSSSTTHSSSRSNNNGILTNGGSNGSSNNHKESGYNSGFESSSSFFFPGERRSRRAHTKRYDGSNSQLSNPEESYDSATGTGTGTGYGSATGRKRQKVNRHLASGGNGGSGAGGSGNTSNPDRLNGSNGQYNSGGGHGSNGDVSSAGENSSNSRIVTDNPKLNEFLYGEEFLKRQEKLNTRHSSSKNYVPCMGLKVEEINDDLNFLRNAISAMQNIKKGSTAGGSSNIK